MCRSTSKKQRLKEGRPVAFCLIDVFATGFGVRHEEGGEKKEEKERIDKSLYQAHQPP
jgi:hypothetical protein